MPAFNRRRVGAVAVMVAATALIIWASRPKPVHVDVASAEIGPLQVTVGDEGEVRVRDRYRITAPVAGRVDRLSLKPGDAVEAGMVVARLDPAPLDPRTRIQAEARLEAVSDAQRAADAAATEARAGLAQARRDRNRVAELVREGVATTEAKEKVDLALEVATRGVEAADFRAQAAAHDVDVARAALLAGDAPAAGHESRRSGRRTVMVRSPVAGRVLHVADASARVVTAGQTLLDIGDVAHLEVAVDLVSTDAVKVRPYQAMLIDDWGGDRSLAGRVRIVEPAAFTKVSALGIEEQRVTIVGDLLDPAPTLGDRYRVHVRIVLWEAPRVLRVPWSAVFHHAGGWHVYLVEHGRARLRDVTVGHQSATDVEILAGLQAGDRVVRHPTEEVQPGVRVAAP